MGKGGSGKVQVVDYRLSVHYAMCSGPIDSINSLVIGDKPVAYVQSENGSIHLDLPNLFGGPKQGGGVEGDVYGLFGEPDQIMPDFLAQKMDRTPTTMTGYRYLAGLFFTASGLLTSGFKWGTTNPTVPAVQMNVTRYPRGLLSSPAIGQDANPAHIIYELATDTDWGLGRSGGTIDLSSFEASAATLRAEELGLSFKWTRQQKAEDFINDILQYIDGEFYFDFSIGRWKLVLIRDDYDPSEVLDVNPSCATLTRLDRGLWGDTINEVAVSYTNPLNEGSETVRVQDLANIAIQGGIASDNKAYPGVRRAALAARLGLRDLQRLGAPMKRVEMELDRRFWRINPASVLRLNWPEEDIVDVIFRIGSIKRGKGSSATITVNLIEDVFSSPFFDINTAGGLWTDPSIEPVPITEYFLGAAPYFLVAQSLGDATAQAISYPTTHLMALINDSVRDVRQVDFQTQETLPSGDLEWQERGTFDTQNLLSIAEALVVEPVTTITINPVVKGIVPEVGMFMMLYDATNPNAVTNEMGLITAVSDNDLTVSRGLLDTVPGIWPSGTNFWLIRGDSRILDLGDRIIGVEEQYKFLPLTSLGRLPADEAPEVDVTPSNRFFQPYRPTFPKVNTVNAAQVSVSRAVGSFTLSWFRRNRITETSVLLKWNDGDVTPEVGQTTKITVYDASNTLLATFAGETGTSKVITMSSIGSPLAGVTLTVYLESARDGYASRTKSTIRLLITA